MDLGLKGKVALVAAGSKGIGLATAKMLAEEGCLVSICGRSQESLDEAAALIGTNTLGLVCDVSIGQDIDRWIQESRSQLGPIDIMVTNTGGPPAGSWQAISDEQWQKQTQGSALRRIKATMIRRNARANLRS